MASKSKILSVVHQDAKDLHKIGLMGEMTMREFDTLCLPPVKEFSAKQHNVFEQNIKPVRQCLLHF